MDRRNQRNLPADLLPFPAEWGGARVGAGRKPSARRPASHRARPEHAAGNPVHVTLRLASGLPSLRQKECYRALRYCFACGREREGFRLVHYSVLPNHLHFLVEAPDRRALSRGIQGLAIRIAKRLNALWARSGRVFAERFHERALRTPREVWNALGYVLRNAQRHGMRVFSLLDPFSSADFFDGWIDGERIGRVLPRAGPAPIAAPRTWLLSQGWRRHGPIDPLVAGTRA